VRPDAPAPVIRVIAYNAEEIVEKAIDRIDQIPAFLNKYSVTWINGRRLGRRDDH
jgi:hypothetical protein